LINERRCLDKTVRSIASVNEPLEFGSEGNVIAASFNQKIATFVRRQIDGLMKEAFD